MIITANKDICFQTINWWSGDHEYMDDLESDNNNKFLIKAFGRTENGDSLSLNILNFTPYFFIQIPTFVKGKNELLSLENWLRSLLPRKLKTSLIKASLMRKKTFYGFKNDEMFNFIRFTFKNIASFRYSIKLFQKEIIIPGINKNPEKFALYESNIEPILRMMHIKNIFPSGWLYLNKNAYLMNNDILTTKCKYDLSICWKNIVRIDKEKIAPISIVSFDLECTSSHGDFPVAAKSYSKLTNELFAYFNEHVKDLNLKENMMIELLKIFDISSIGIFSKVFIKDKDINIEQIHDKIKENIDDIYNYLSGKIIYKKKNDGKMTQDDILKAIIKILGKYHSKENRKIWEEDTRIWQGIFPELQGDCITQIGMTQHLYGDTDCNNKYVFTLGTCDDIDNVNVIRCKNESSLLLQFRDVINEIDPDIITGYNILGFDFSYLYERSMQLGIVNDFCKISRLNDHISNYIEKNLSSSALGENLLKFIEMEGRTIIDLMKVIQRDYKLDSYKLDNVASHFMNLNKNDVTPQ